MIDHNFLRSNPVDYLRKVLWPWWPRILIHWEINKFGSRKISMMMETLSREREGERVRKREWETNLFHMFPVSFFTGILFRNFFTSSSHEICFSFHSSFSSRFLFFHCYSFSSLSFQENYSVILFCYVRKLRSSSFQMVNDLTFSLTHPFSFLSLSLLSSFPHPSFFLRRNHSIIFFFFLTLPSDKNLSFKKGWNESRKCFLPPGMLLNSSFPVFFLSLLFPFFLSLSLLYFLFPFFLFIFSAFESSRHVDYNSFVVCLFKSFHVLLMWWGEDSPSTSLSPSLKFFFSQFLVEPYAR